MNPQINPQMTQMKGWLAAGCRLLVALAVLLGTARSGCATSVYFANVAAGSNNGSSCANAYAIGDGTHGINVAGNWAAGNVLVLCGTITAAPGASSFIQAQASGSAGSPITILFDSATSGTLTATYWSGPAIDLNSQSHIVVNGAGVGLIQATANGSGLANQQDNGECVSSHATGSATDITVENLTCSNLYVEASPADNGGEDTYGIDIWGTTAQVIQNNTIHDAKWAVRNSYTSGTAYTGTSLTMTGNNIYSVDHGYFLTDSSASGAAVASGFYIYGNTFGSLVNWDNTANNNHHDVIHLNANSATAAFSGFYMYNNTWTGDPGANGNAGLFTNEIGGSNTNVSSAWFFNNVFVNTSSNHCFAGGFIAWDNGGTLTAVNNTLISGVAHNACTNNGSSLPGDNGFVYGYGSTGLVAENNIIQGMQNNFFYSPSGSGTAISTVNNQDYYNGGGWTWLGSSTTSLSTWRSSCNCDANAISSNPNLNAGYQPPSGSPVLGTGANLYTTCSGQPTPGLGALCSDKAGAVRASTGGWTMGAYSPAVQSATNYYVDNCVNAGSDSYDGKEQTHTTGTTGPWLTIAHVNAQVFNPGDAILFQGGCTWREQLTAPSSGTAGSPITFGAYGSGRPVVSGDVLPSAVPEETGGIFASGFETESSGFTTVWTGKSESSGNTCAINAATGTTHYGSKAAEVTYAGTTGVTYFYKDITAASSIDIRFYFKLNSLFQLQALSKHATLFTIWDGTASVYPVRVWLYSPSAGVANYVGLAGDFRLNTGSTTSWTAATQLDPVRWHIVEFNWVSSATAGGLQVWLDGTSVYNSGFASANSNYMAREIRMGGGITSGTGGDPPVAGSAVYYDDVKFSTTGPIGNTVLSQPYNVDLGGQSYVTVKGFDLTNAATAGVRFNGAANDTVSGNIIETSNDGGVNVRLSQGAPGQALANDGILLTGTFANSNIITGNVIRRNKARGIHFAAAASNANSNTVAYNYIYLNETGGIRADNSQVSDLIENNTLEDNYYGLDFAANSGFTIQNNLVSRNAALEFNAGASAALTHSYNLYWRADNSTSSITYGGSSYQPSGVATFEATAQAGNPRPDIERALGWVGGVSAVGIRASYVASNGALFAGDASSHIVKSVDGGQTWTTVYTFSDNASVQTMFSSLFVDAAGNIYDSPNDPNATTTAQGIYRSPDGGTTWTNVYSLSGSASGTYMWGFDQDTAGNLWTGLYPSAAQTYESTNGGTTWANSYNDASGRHIHFVSVDKSTNNVYAVEGDSSSPWYSNKIEKTVNGGTTWATIMPNIPQCFTAITTGSFRLFSTDSAWPGIYRTTDDTNYAVALDLTMTNTNGVWMRRDPVSGTIYASFAVRSTPQPISYIFVSYDNGLTWRTAKLISGGTLGDGSDAASNIFQGLMFTNIFPDPGNHNAAVALAINREDDTSLSFYSTAIGKGTGLGLVQDLNGNAVIPGQVTIGAVQYQPKPGVGVM